MAMAKRQTKKKASLAPELFNKSDFIVFSNYGGIKKENPENSKIFSEYERIKTKIRHLKAIIKSNLSSDYSFGGAVRSDSRAGKGQPLKYKEYIWLYIYNDKNSKIPKSEGGKLKDVPVNVYNLSFDKDGISICLDFKHGELPEELELPEENKKKRVIKYDGKSYNDLADEIVDYCRTHSDDYINNYKIIEAHKQGELLQVPQSELNNNDETEPNGMKVPGTKKTDILKKWPMNLILYGPPGTGKTYNTVNKALQIVLESEEFKALEVNASKEQNSDDKRKVFTDRYKELKREGRIEFITFHQSMSYEDFVEGIKPIANGNGVTYKVMPGIFKQICEKASTAATKTIDQALTEFIKDVESKGSTGYDVPYYKSGGHFTIFTNQKAESFKVTNIKSNSKATQSATFENIKKYYSNRSESKNTYVKCIVELLEQYYLKCLNKKSYVLIIDEINRGNVSQIFGELITLIEEDKRLGNKEELKVKLPYSSTCKKETEGTKEEEEFGVPNNLYIIGTMNTADRSVEALDTALRRRFSFEEMMPKYTDEEAQGIERVIEVGGEKFKLSIILKTINQRIEVLKGREQQIGHSYLMKCKDDKDLKKAFKDKVVPLLQEYFYGDYSQIGLVLGPGFVEKVKTSDNIFPKGFEFPSLNEVYHLLTDKKWEQLNMNEALHQMGVPPCSSSLAENTNQAGDPQIEHEEAKTEDSKEGIYENLS